MGPGRGFFLPQTDLARDLKAIHSGHLYIHKNDVIGLAIECLKHLETITANIGRIAHLLKQTRRHFLVDQIVVREQYAQGQAAGQRRVQFRDRRFPSRHGLFSSQPVQKRVAQSQRLDRLGHKFDVRPLRTSSQAGEKYHRHFWIMH